MALGDCAQSLAEIACPKSSVTVAMFTKNLPTFAKAPTLTMAGFSKHFMRIVAFAMLFQFVAAVFFTVVTQGTELGEDDHGSVHSHHSSVIVPQLLKEKEESETNDNDLIIELVALIDFTHHSSVLTKSHESKLTPFTFHDRIDHHPPLFTLHCVFII